MWASIHLRGNTHTRLRTVVDIALAGLAEEAIKILRILQSELAQILPDPSEPMDPQSVIVDPSKVEANAKRGIQILKQRHQLPNQFAKLLGVCSWLKYVSVVFTAGTTASLVAYLCAYAHRTIWQSTVWLTVSVVVVGVALLSAYSVLNSRIQVSIETANPLDHLASGAVA
ncbi:hypothetical protein GALL_361770 [mine drainage metagenome]|uniref:Uncharacterized protein n=1 Tax=mine drainage metagenome TaxID=410659 RepID=A0A1J5QQ41_9ZZZZ